MAITVERLEAEIAADPKAAIAALDALSKKLDAAARDRQATIDIDTRDAERAAKRLKGELDGLDNAFQRNRSSVSAFGVSAHTGSRALQGFAIAVKGLQFGAIYSGATLAASGIQTLTGAAAGAAATLAPLSGLLPILGAGFASLGAGLGATILGFSGVGQAVKAYTQVEKSGGSAARASASAARSLASAQRDLVKAEEAVAEARLRAAKDLKDYRRDVASAVMDEQDAVLRLQEAQDRLRKAQQGVGKSAFNLTKQTDDFTGKVYEVATASSEAVDRAAEQADAQREVQRAQMALTRAQEATAESRARLSDAEKKGIEGSDRVVDALQRVADAQFAVQQAQERMKETAGGSAAATKNLEMALARLSPAGVAFVDFVRKSLQPAFRELQKSAQQGLLPGVQAGLASMLDLMPMLRARIFEIAKTVGDSFKDFGAFLATPEMRSQINDFFKGMNAGLSAILKIGKPFTRIMVAISNAAQPFVVLIANDITRGLTKFADWLDTVAGKEAVTDFFENTYRFTKLWWNVLKPLAGAIGGVIKAATPLATWMLEELAKWLTTLSDKANSIEGQASLKKWFEDLKPIIKEAAGFIKDFVGAFFGPDLAKSSLLDTLKALREDFMPSFRDLLKSLNESNFGPRFVTFITGVSDALRILVQGDGPLGIFLSTFGKFLTMVSKVADGWAGPLITGLLLLKGALGGLTVAKGLVSGIGGLLTLKGGGGKGGIGGMLAGGIQKVFVVNMVPGGMPGGLPGLPGKGPKHGKPGLLNPGSVKSVITKAAAPLAAGAAALAVGSIVQNALDDKFGKDKSTTDRLGNAAATVGKYAGAGAAAGSFIPLLGTGIGAAIGTGVGSVKSIYDWYWGDNKKTSEEAKKKAKRAADDLARNLMLQSRPVALAAGAMAGKGAATITDYTWSKTGGWIPKQVALGMTQNMRPVALAAGMMSAIPKDKMKAADPDYSKGGRQVATAVATGIDAGGAGVASAVARLRASIKAELEKKIITRVNSQVVSGAISWGEAGLTGRIQLLGARGDGPGAPGPSGTPGGGTNTARGMANYAVRNMGGRISSGYRTPSQNAAVGGSPTSYHLDRLNPAQDYVGPNMQAAFNLLYAKYGANIREMIYGKYMVKNGRLMPYRRNDHYDHLHVAHSGGMVSKDWPTLPGLRRDERPAILQIGERVVPRSQTGGTAGGMSDAQFESVLRRVMANAKAPVQIDQTFNEKVDPRLLSSELAWRLQ